MSRDLNRLAGLLDRQLGQCYFCSETVDVGAADQLREATIEHLLPRSRGGTDQPDNVVVACLACNRDKRDMLEGEYLDYLDMLYEAGADS